MNGYFIGAIFLIVGAAVGWAILFAAIFGAAKLIRSRRRDKQTLPPYATFTDTYKAAKAPPVYTAGDPPVPPRVKGER